MNNRPRRLLSEALGSGLLFAAVIGSGVMGERLAGGNVAVALLGNTLATGAVLGFVLAQIAGALAGSVVATRLFPDAPV